MGKIIGIDLGTTNSVVAIMEGKEPKIITNEEGGRLTPSVVAFDDKGEILVGQIARRQAITNPENTVFSIKRFMGRKMDEVAEETKKVPYKVVKVANGDAQVEIRGKRYTAPEISARVLMKLKRAAEEYLGEKVTDAVITVPAYFNDAQRQATKDAGKIAGLEVKRIVNEPTAAALAYGLNKGKDHLVAVYDFGGGTFDISVLEVGEKVVEVVATNGDTHLGGDDIDNLVMQFLMAEFKKDQGIDVSKDKMVIQRLKEAAEKAKIELSSTQETEINLPFLTADASGPKHMQIKLSRAKLEQIMGDLVRKTMEPVKKCLADAGKSPKEIDEVVLVGGSTRIPMVQKLVTEYFGRDAHKGVNPDEVVALGAAVQAGVLSGEVKDILLLDVTPLSLGIETLGGVMTTLIPRNTTIPTKKTETFSTASDSQSSVEVHVLQGERPMARDNRTLGKFHLDGIPPAPRGVPQIEVTFDIDANGIVNVSAKDKATNKEQNITITASSGLTERDIERMVADAEKNEAEDKKRKDGIEAKNQLDSLIYNTQKLIDGNRDKIPEADRVAVEEALKEGKTVLEANKDNPDAEALKAALETVQKASHKMAEAMYKQAGGSGPAPGAPGGDSGVEDEGGGGGGGDKKDEGVIDAEFEEQK
ncbi:MAG: molecular chaperone DnaK [Deltaproteobacteria bacterium]|nr:molecular chaperone DnaK [Deltaproteobacteria bacterium]